MGNRTFTIVKPDSVRKGNFGKIISRLESEGFRILALKKTSLSRAQAEVAEVFELRQSFEWRGLGAVPYGALRLRDAYAEFDAERRFAVARATLSLLVAAAPESLRRIASASIDARVLIFTAGTTFL